MEFNGTLTKDEIKTTAPEGLYRILDEAPRVVTEWYDAAHDAFAHDVPVVTVGRVRYTGGPLPVACECYQDGDRQVIFADVPVIHL